MKCAVCQQERAHPYHLMGYEASADKKKKITPYLIMVCEECALRCTRCIVEGVCLNNRGMCDCKKGE